MAQIKKIKLHFSIWGRDWKGEAWANSPAHARLNLVHDFINGTVDSKPLSVSIKAGKKKISFAGFDFEPKQPELWPDDEEGLMKFAMEAIRSELKVQRI